jgi:HEAT repeat protein
MSQNPPFSQVIQALLDKDAPFPARYLHRFSDIEPGDLKSVMDVWPQISIHRKLTLLEDLEGLAEADTLTSFEDLARSLLADPEAGVRIRSIHLLWECPDAKLIPIYLDILKTDADNETRAAAASILGLFIYQGELEEIPQKTLHEVEEGLLDAVRNGATAHIRRRALEALGASSRKEVPALIETAYHRKEADWVVSSLFAMGRSNDDRWEKYVLAHIYNQDEDIRSEAIRAAGKLGLSAARVPLLDLLEDEEDLEMRREIVWALSGIGGENVRAKLEELLDIETDEDEVDFLEEALENLLFTDDLNQFGLLEIETNGEDEDEE